MYIVWYFDDTRMHVTSVKLWSSCFRCIWSKGEPSYENVISLSRLKSNGDLDIWLSDKRRNKLYQWHDNSIQSFNLPQMVRSATKKYVWSVWKSLRCKLAIFFRLHHQLYIINHKILVLGVSLVVCLHVFANSLQNNILIIITMYAHMTESPYCAYFLSCDVLNESVEGLNMKYSMHAHFKYILMYTIEPYCAFFHVISAHLA